MAIAPKYIPPLNGDTSNPNRSYTDGDPDKNQEGSQVSGKAIEWPQREIINVLKAVQGLTLDGNKYDQLLAAINGLIAAAVTKGLFKDKNETLEAGFKVKPLALDGSSGTITPDYAKRNLLTVTLDKNMTLANPASMPEGGFWVIIATVAAGGSYSLSTGDKYKVSHGRFNSAAGSINILWMLPRPDGKIDVRITQGGK